MEFLKKALNPFMEFEEKPKSTQSDISASKVIDKPDSNSSIKSFSKVDQEKFQKYFQGLLQSLNLPGPDFLEFLQAVEDLKEDVPNEDSRYKIANKTLKIPKDKLIETAKFYIKNILEDKDKFLQKVGDKKDEEVESRKKKIQDLESMKSKNEEMIKKLSDEIHAADIQINSLSQEIQNQESKIENNKIGYLTANREYVDSINNNISKIQSLL